VVIFLKFSRKNLLGILLTASLFISLVIISFSVSNVREPVSKAATLTETKTFNAGTSDGYIIKSTASKTSHPDSGACNLYFNTQLIIGQQDRGSSWTSPGYQYASFRSYVSFDTSSIPDNANITSVSLNQTVVQKGNFTIRARNYNWGSSVDCNDWGGDPPTATLVGSYNANNLPAIGSRFAIGLNGSLVNKTGTTYLMLTSDRDEANYLPASGEIAGFYSADTASPPQLVIDYTYSVPDQPTNPTNPTNPGGGNSGSNSGGSSTGGSRGSNSNRSLPNTIKKLNLKVSVPFLLGEMKVNTGIDQYSKELTLKHGETDYSIDTADLGLTLNKIYTLTFSGDKILKKKIQFNASSAETNVNAMELTLGDLNADSVIDSKDQLLLIESIKRQTPKGDLNSDGATNSLDWSILMYNLGKVGD
jgi:hypothetical protein